MAHVCATILMLDSIRLENGHDGGLIGDAEVFLWVRIAKLDLIFDCGLPAAAKF